MRPADTAQKALALLFDPLSRSVFICLGILPLEHQIPLPWISVRRASKPPTPGLTVATFALGHDVLKLGTEPKSSYSAQHNCSVEEICGQKESRSYSE